MHFPVEHAFFLALVTSSPVFASVVGPEQLQHRQDGSSTQPLTITLSLDTPTVTYTEAAVTSAWAVYANACGPVLARAFQDGLAEYISQGGAPATNISDPDFRQWLSQLYPDYTNAHMACEEDQHDNDEWRPKSELNDVHECERLQRALRQWDRKFEQRDRKSESRLIEGCGTQQSSADSLVASPRFGSIRIGLVKDI
ncbi:hypothetical protein C8R46DRAFT_1033074 [Mycena filopes]|nr:hypothetical protein C8R46DRAFT_1033074 [Mycena filopes]